MSNAQGLNRFTLDDPALIEKVNALALEAGTVSCEYNFVNLICWAPIYEYGWFNHQGRIVVYDGKDKIMFMPLGSAMSSKELVQLSERAIAMGLSPDICLVPEQIVKECSDIGQYYEVQQDRDAGEYIYQSKSLAELKGTKLHKKRNLISQFKRKYPDYQVLPLTFDRLFLARNFARDLLNIMTPIPAALKEEFLAMKVAFDHWEPLALEGIIIVVDDKIAAFSVFSPLGDDSYNIHFEKSNIAFKGAGQLINKETAARLADKAKFINREQDLGIKGLRQAKLSYEPDHIWIPYILKYKSS